MLSWRRFVPWAVIIAVLGCNRPDASVPDNTLDPVTSQSEASAILGRAAATAGHRHLGDTNRYPSDGSTPKPGPSPTPTPSGVCDLCDGKNWIGDGRPRNPCPQCNADGKKPPQGFSSPGLGDSSADGSAGPNGSFQKLDRSMTDIISGENQRDPVIKADILKDGLLDYLTDKAKAAGDSEPTPIPEESPVASLPDTSKPPEPEVEPVKEPAPQPVATVVGYRAKSDGAMVDQWYKEASSFWENLGWKVQPKIEASFKVPRSYFVVSEPDGTVTRIYEYLNKDSLARAKAPVTKPAAPVPQGQPRSTKSAQ